MSPEQRLFLEVAWEALEDAGYAGRRAAEAVTGVFAGILSNEYLCTELLTSGQVAAEGSIATGSAMAIVANRVSYLLDLQGPSLCVDTACSSGLMAAHLARQSLLAGECDLAIVGGVNVGTSLGRFMALSKARMLAPDGRCKPFDAGGDGYGCGEGVAALVLKPLHRARQDRDHVYAVIKGSAVRQDGRTNGLTAPNSLAQERLLLAAYEAAGVRPDTVTYLEAHGTGTALGDPIELQALQRVFGRFSARRGFCGLGSVKGNVGHLEGAAGTASLIKVALALEHRALVPSLHFRAPNPRIDFAASAFYLTDRHEPWPSPAGLPRRAGVSSLGYGGTICHAVLEEAPARPAPDRPPAAERPRHVLVLSAATESALGALAERYRALAQRTEPPPLADICYTAATGRAHLPYRLAVVAGWHRELADRLGAGAVIRGAVERSRKRPRVAFVLGGPWPQDRRVAEALYRSEPTFRRELERCAAILAPHLERPLPELLYPPDGRPAPLASPAAEAASSAVGYCLARLWSSWGIRPAAVLGADPADHAAACLDGSRSLEAVLPLVAGRGRQPWEASQFGEAIRRLAADGISIFVEVGPGQALAPLVAEALAERGPGADEAAPPLVVSSLGEGDDDWEALLSALGHVWVRGVEVDWEAYDLGRQRARVSLPTYPFERQRHWFVRRGQPAQAAPAAGDHRPSAGEQGNGADGRQVLQALRQGRLSVGEAMDHLLGSPARVGGGAP